MERLDLQARCIGRNDRTRPSRKRHETKQAVSERDAPGPQEGCNRLVFVVVSWHLPCTSKVGTAAGNPAGRLARPGHGLAEIDARKRDELSSMTPIPRKTLNPEVTERLRALQRQKSTGRLHAASDSWSRELFFRDGRIVGIRTSVEEERLGNLLVRFGRITPQHFEDASLFVRHGWRLGEILAELKVIDRSEIDPMLRRQATEVACAVLTETGAEIRFEETSELFTTLEGALSIGDVVLEAARLITDVGGFRADLSSDDRRFRPVEPSVVAECASLTPEDVFLLSRFQGGSTLPAVLHASSLGEGSTVRALVGLVESGLLLTEDGSKSEERPGSARIELDAVRKDVDRMFRRLARLDPWRALDLPQDVGIETARLAFRDAVMRYHPDRHHSIPDPELHKELASICEKFTTAFTCLTTALQLRRSSASESAIPLASTLVTSSASPEPCDPRARVDSATSRPAPAIETSQSSRGGAPAVPPSRGDVAENAPPAPGSYNAEVYFREGARALARGDFWRAVELLRQAVERRNDQAPYHFLLAEALSRNPLWRHEAEGSYRRAIELDPYRIKHYEALARLYEAAGLSHRAEGVLRQARAMGLVSSEAASAPGQELAEVS